MILVNLKYASSNVICLSAKPRTWVGSAWTSTLILTSVIQRYYQGLLAGVKLCYLGQKGFFHKNVSTTLCFVWQPFYSQSATTCNPFLKTQLYIVLGTGRVKNYRLGIVIPFKSSLCCQYCICLVESLLHRPVYAHLMICNKIFETGWWRGAPSTLFREWWLWSWTEMNFPNQLVWSDQLYYNYSFFDPQLLYLCTSLRLVDARQLFVELFQFEG